MTDRAEQRSLREYTGEIRHLDPTRARELVALFRRPIPATGQPPAYDTRDPVTAGTCGLLSLECSPHDAAAGIIGHYASHLYLHEVIRLPLSVAREVAQHRGHLYLDKLTSITDSVAAVLATHTGGGLSLNNLKKLSVSAAWLLGRHRGELSLNAITELDDDAALGLAQHDNELYLWGVKSLSSRAAAALSHHRGDLLLGGLTRLPGDVATHLARHRGKLHLHGLRRLKPAAARALGGRTGHLCLRSLESLAPTEAQLLSRHRGPLYLNAVEITDAVAHYLGRHQGSLSVSPPRGISDHHLSALINHVGPLSLGGRKKIDQRTATVLASQQAPRGIHGLSGLYVNDVEHVAPPVAAILATHRAGELSLNGITLLAEDSARELIRHPLLSLDGVSSVTDRIADILASHSGGALSLRGLRHVSPSGLAKLRRNPSIELPRHLRADSAESASQAPAPPHSSRAEMIAAINRIARAGEEALSIR